MEQGEKTPNPKSVSVNVCWKSVTPNPNDAHTETNDAFKIYLYCATIVIMDSEKRHWLLNQYPLTRRNRKKCVH